MIFTQPADWEPAIQKMKGKSPVGSMLSTREWQEVPVALRDRAFFSARVENARFLQTAQDMINSFLKQERETLPGGTTALKADGRARFIAEMQKLAISEGMGPEGLGPIKDKSVLDVRSNTRLGLIWDTQMRQAYHYGQFKGGLDESILMVYPAQRFVRHPGAQIKRPLHEENENVVRLKNDTEFWLRMNDPEIGGFGVPYGPWGFNSYMDVRDVDRQEAERLGLITEDAPPPKVREVDFNDQLKASVENIDHALESKLRAAFGRQAEFKGGTVYWKGQVPKPTKLKVVPPSPLVTPPVLPPRPTLETGAQLRAGIKAFDPNVDPEYQANLQRLAEMQRIRVERTGEGATIAGRTKLWEEAGKIRQRQAELLDTPQRELRKALQIPKEMRGTIALAKGQVYSGTPTAQKWEATGKKAQAGAQWVETVVPKQSLQSVIFDYHEGRAFASPESFKININERTSTETAVHEIGHILETINPGWYLDARDFRDRRTKHETLVSLKSEYPNSTYKPDEVAYRDKWTENGAESIYCGKVYPEQWNSTEIVTMGLQWLYERPLEFALKDPHYFDFMVNLIRGHATA